MQVIINKDDFVKVINGLKEVDSYQSDLNKVFRKHDVDGYLFQPDCSVQTIRLLHLIFGELDRDEWIEYYCFDLDYGKKWKEGMIRTKDGEDIPLRTPEELYDFLLSSYNVNKECETKN